MGSDFARQAFSHHLISDDPAPLLMGPLPPRWDDIPARVVVNLCGVMPIGSPGPRVVFAMPFLDLADPAALPARARLEAFADAVHGFASAEPSYWHCHAGLNRSGLLVAMYLHRHRGLAVEDAIALMRQRRSPMVLGNRLFEARLRDWYGTVTP